MHYVECVDVNVTPDKRQIFLQEEKLLLATLKSSLIAMYETGVNKISLNNTPQITGSKCAKSLHSHLQYEIWTNDNSLFYCSCLSGFSRYRDSNNLEGPRKALPAGLTSEDDSEAFTQSPKTSFNLAGLKAAFSKQQFTGIGTKTFNNKTVPSGPTQKKMQSFFHCSERTNYNRQSGTASNAASPLNTLKSDLIMHERKSDMEVDSGLSEQSSVTETPETQCVEECGSSSEFDSPDSVLEEPSIKTEPYSESVDEVHNVLETSEPAISPDRISSPKAKKIKWDDNLSNQPHMSSSSVSSASCELFDKPIRVQKKIVPLQFSITELGRRMEKLKTQQRGQNDQELKYRRFRAKIKPGENQSAEDELKKEIRYRSLDLVLNSCLMHLYELSVCIFY